MASQYHQVYLAAILNIEVVRVLLKCEMELTKGTE